MRFTVLYQLKAILCSHATRQWAFGGIQGWKAPLQWVGSAGIGYSWRAKTRIEDYCRSSSSLKPLGTDPSKQSRRGQAAWPRFSTHNGGYRRSCEKWKRLIVATLCILAVNSGLSFSLRHKSSNKCGDVAERSQEHIADSDSGWGLPRTSRGSPRDRLFWSRTQVV